MSKTTTFTLYNIDTNRINNGYNLGIPCEELYKNKNIKDDNTTKLTELNKEIPDVISFLDESKHPRCCYISMIDINKQKNTTTMNYNCFWCRNPFETVPIGCPIKYIPNQIEKKYYSHISRDMYNIKENITTNRKNELLNEENKENTQITLRNEDYYETFGIFCSFNCCQAWINDNKHDRMYDMSTMLLAKIYNTIMNTKTIVISPAPHWLNLMEYGGNLTIEKFRDSFYKIDYTYHGTTKHVPNFLPIGSLFEENIKF